MKRRCVPLLLLSASGGFSQSTDLPPGVLFTANAIRHVQQSLTGVPDYACLETIDRQQLHSPSRVFQRLDVVRLEVGKVAGKELFSWPGASHFEERPVSDFVAGGLIGDGAYSLFADDVFLNKAALTKYRGPEELNGREAIRLDYTVSPLRTKFTLQTASGTADVGYSGSYWVEPGSMDLLRLDVTADSLPPELQLARANVSVEYRTAKIGNRTVTLAQSSTIEFVKLSGDTSRNRIDFTHCRRFGGEARMISDTDAAATSQAPERQVFHIAPGLKIPLRLTTAVDAGTAGVGDEITASVTSNVRDGKGVEIPAGSIVHGRIRRLEHRVDRTEYVALAIEFSEIETGNRTAEFIAQLQSVDPLPGLDLQHVVRIKNDKARMYTDIFDSELPGVGYLYLTDKPFRLAANLRMIWITQ